MDTKTVYVGLSGGVDSSVAALRLIHQGYNVVGVFIKVWHPTFLKCDWEQERLDAMRVAAKLDIPFLTCDAEEIYKTKVADYFIDSYRKGLTPNPDVMCNKEVKFGAFLEFAQKNGADFIATGHYAQRFKTEGYNPPVWKLQRGVDENKDQSYFLWTLTQKHLSQVLFPVGDSPKKQIRKEASEAGLLTATKKDSQGICFLGHVDIPEFLSHFITLKEGDVLDSSGEVVGFHKGALVYTKGQRHGFTITKSSTSLRPHYVLEKDISKNTIIVTTSPIMENRKDLINLHNVNWITKTPVAGQILSAQIRYRQTPFTVTVSDCAGDVITLSQDNLEEPVTAGQSCVLYDGSVCMGGGIIS